MQREKGTGSRPTPQTIAAPIHTTATTQARTTKEPACLSPFLADRRGGGLDLNSGGGGDAGSLPNTNAPASACRRRSQQTPTRLARKKSGQQTQLKIPTDWYSNRFVQKGTGEASGTHFGHVASGTQPMIDVCEGCKYLL